MKAISSNTDAIYAEYPFLEKFRPRVQVSRASICRWDVEALSDSPNILWSERFYLLDVNGNVVVEVPRQRYFRLLDKSESIGQTLARIGSAANQTRYLLKLSANSLNPLVLCKLPKGYENAAEWLRAQVERDRVEMRAADL